MSEEDYLWVARDENGDLYLYQEKPQKQDNCAYWKDTKEHFELDPDLFPNVKWEDEEPFAVVLQQAIFKSK